MATDIKDILQREAKWQQRWRAANAFVPADDGKKPRFYNLVEFPFLSGAGLHAGHMMNYTGMDVLARFRRARGFDVLFPMGFDAMGIAGEHYATKIGRHPADVANELKQSYSEMIDRVGWSVSPATRVATSDPEYIRWTQWMFIQFWRAGLAYKSALPMNWCPHCKTNLTNEELEDGCCERCHGPVEKRMKVQWNLALSRYAQKLLDGLNTVDFDARIKKDEVNLIGRSTGADVDFRVGDDIMTVYTTRPDTIFGVTFCVIAPEHKLLREWLDGGRIKNVAQVEEYIKISKAKSEIERTDATREKTGVRLDGVMATNPYNGRQIPIFTSDYVLADYAYGTIMAVPAHDGRDYAFAQNFGLEIIPVLDNGDVSMHAQEGDGLHINSEFMNGMNKADAIAAAIKYGTEHGFARATVKYKLKDWGFSRQMYWGEPIPMIHCEKCGWVPVPDDQLPVMQPYMQDFRPTDDGDSPLARATDWVNVPCPCCGAPARRETDTMPGWAGSSWYFMRYIDPQNDKEFCSREKMENWMPVTHYNGGHEHNTRHLIYSRFWHRALYDLGLVNTAEPYARRTAQGLLMGNDGYKMSKSRGNGFMVADLVASVGADAGRVAVLSLGPWENNVVWTDGALAGVQRFLKRVEALSDNLTDDAPTPDQERLINRLISDVTERIDGMRFNTAISAMMEYLNAFGGKMPRPAYLALIRVLNPFAPHLTEEMWEKLGHDVMLACTDWPTFDASKLADTEMTVVVSVNGKRAADFRVPVEVSESDLVAAARVAAGAKLGGAEIIKTIVVPRKMVNFVVKK